MTHGEQNNSSDTGTKVPMTHDELLARIMELDEFREYKDGLIKQSNALRAVVELHKPAHPEFEHLMTYCEGCSITEFIEYSSCPTIQAIDKELK